MRIKVRWSEMETESIDSPLMHFMRTLLEFRQRQRGEKRIVGCEMCG